MHVSAPAKINLHLRVGPPRTDGFHPLLTWMTTIGLSDKITLRENPNPGKIGMTCTDETLPCDDRNLVVKAAKLMQAGTDRSVSIHLEKQIPHGGGLGGGSSDAAFTLRALNDFWQLNKTDSDLAELAAKLGSDIPFFLYGPSSICQGRGEIVRPVPAPRRARWIVLILPALSMPTPAVYRQFDAAKAGRQSDVGREPDWNAWAELPSIQLLKELINDLELPAFILAPQLHALQSEIEETLARTVRMSGSGSSLFTLYDQHAEAISAAKRVEQLHQTRAIAIELAPAI